MNYTKKRWMYLIFCGIINICLGSLYAWSVFAAPLAAHIGGLTGTELTVGDLAIVYTFSCAVGPVTMIIGGMISDKLGPKLVFLLSGIFYGSGFILSSFATSVPMLMLFFGLGTGLGGSMGYGCAVSTAVKYFPDKRGLAGGVATACYGGSSIFFPFIILALNGATGITNTMLIFGIVFVILICGPGLLIKKCPDSFTPDGWTPPAPAPGQKKVEDKNWRQMLSTPIFYLMLITMFCGALAGAMIISQSSGVAVNLIEVTPTTASLVVSIMAAFNVIGRLISGSLSDKIGRVSTLTLAFCIGILAAVLFLFCGVGTFPLFIAGVACVGLSYGSIMGVYPGFTTDRFGTRYNSLNYAIIFIGFAVAGIVGPIVMKSVYSSTGTYNFAFIMCLALSALGLIFTFVFRGIEKKAVNKA